jgi:ATP adenylyltransferase/5',5'''-P-1,P-4-tetraphosphate phosphorylase II
VEQDGIPFIVRVLANLARKDQAGKDRTRKAAASTEFNQQFPLSRNLALWYLAGYPSII